ncbi:MAG: preprotein translocase subunit YajC [Deltaproteobacteria bacterium]|jgi:preprotein translocase subunit YajC|nr:preprotein translocase subunit YajC [Deltaproteobacteria bacterium]MBN2688161.1 preprotein translocase subunit YajC [Deltaproteobacteria bacterium]
MTGLAYAMGSAGKGAQQGGELHFIILMVLIFGIFYFLLIRPQQKRQKQVREMLDNLGHGDMVVTAGGLHGKVTALTETIATLEISEKVRVKVSRNHIAAVTQKAQKE